MAKESEAVQKVAEFGDEDRMVDGPVNPVKRSIYRNCLFGAALAELMTLGVIFVSWYLMIVGKAVFGDPLTNAVVAGVFTLVGAQIALASTFAPRDDQMTGGNSWYPNVLIHVSIGVANAALVLAMGVYAVIGLAFAVISNLNSLAAQQRDRPIHLGRRRRVAERPSASCSGSTADGRQMTHL